MNAMQGLTRLARFVQQGGSQFRSLGVFPQLSKPVNSRNYASSQSAAEQNMEARIQLAAVYRICERLNFHEGVCNHLSLMAPAKSGEGEVMLLIPYGMHWKQVRASDLLAINDAGEIVEGEGEAELSAFSIHKGVRMAAPVKCVLHLHTPNVTAIGCLEDPTILPLHQTYLRFHNRIAYDHNFGGAVESLEEGHRLGRCLGDKDALILCNHGGLTVGTSVAIAFDHMYYLERLCEVQRLAMSTGKKIRMLTDLNVSDEYYAMFLSVYAVKHFQAWLDVLHKESPEFAT